MTAIKDFALRTVRTVKMRINKSAIALAGRNNAIAENPVFKIYEPPPGVLPKGTKLAMDDVITGQQGWAALSGRFSEGIGFMGYPYLAELSQRPEYRRISETIAKEMTRKWIKLQATGEDDKTEKLKAIETEMKRLKVQHAFREVAELDGFFGRAHIYLDTGDGENPEELKSTIGDGSSDLTKMKVNPQKRLQRIAVIEPVWTYPNAYNASDPLRMDYFNPTSWFVQGRLIHSTRLLTFVGREVPDLLKPTYSFGGLSLSQMAKPYIDNWLRTRQAVSDLIYKFSTTVLKTNLKAALDGGSGEEMEDRAKLFTAYHDNHGMMMLDKDSEDFINVSVPLGSLDHLQAQSQEHMSAVSGIPLVKLLGITPSGLNASSDGEMRCFYDWIEATQEAFFTDHLSTIINLIQFSLYGELDPEIGFKWEPLWTMDDAALATVRKTNMDTDIAAINGGIIMPQEARIRLAAEEDSPYASLDLDVPLPPPPGSEPQGGPGGEPGGIPEGGPGDDPAAGPAPNPFTAKKATSGSAKGGEQDAFGGSGKKPTGGSAGGSNKSVSQGTDEWNEAAHPRGQPENAGEFGPGGGHAATPALTPFEQEQLRTHKRMKMVFRPDGGFTYQPMTREAPFHGYAVSIFPDRSFAKPVGELTEEDFKSFILKNLDLLRNPKNFAGAWHDPISHMAFLDVSIVTQDEQEAVALCKKYDQIGYFDLRKHYSVDVDRSAHSGGAISN
jgi:phage-related protein (TIGR01555 family)